MGSIPIPSSKTPNSALKRREKSMSTSSKATKFGWNYRIFARRTILIKAKNDRMRKIVVLDLSTGLPFALEAAETLSMDSVEVEKEYSARFKVYTSQNLEGVDSEFVEFFEVLDVDQPAEDFIKAYWVYPDRIRFELVEVEPL
jgi:hypothetical protein